MSDDGKGPDGSKALPEQPPGPFFRIRTRLLLTFGVVALLGVTVMELVGLLGLPPLGIQGSIEQTRRQSLERLNELADGRRQILDDWLRERRQDGRALADSAQTGAAAAELADRIAGQVRDGSVDPDFWAAYRRLPRYVAQTRELTALRDASGGIYAAIGLLDTRTGYMVASSRERAIGIGLAGDPLFELARSPGHLEVIDIYRSRVDGRHYLGFAHQVFERDADGNKSEMRAVALFLVRAEAIPLTGGALAGPGESGETLLVNQDRRLLSPLRHALPDGSAAKPLVDRIQTRIAVLAAGGGEGLIADLDYRGVPVLAAYRHVPVSPELGLGIVVKQDEAEVLAPIYDTLRQRLTLGLLTLMVMGVAAAFVARRLAAPIDALTGAARSIQAGDFRARSGLQRRDEIGLLARTFDGMAQRIQEWHLRLSQELDLRTRLLQRTSQLYRVLGETNQTIVRASDPADLFDRVCRIAVRFGGFKAAWIRRLDPLTGGWLPASGFSGEQPEVAQAMELGAGALADLCRKTGDTAVVADLSTDARIGEYRDKLLEAGCRGLAWFPLCSEGALYGAFGVASAEPDIFDEEGLILLEEMAVDIGFALDNFVRDTARRQAESDLRSHESLLRAVVENTPFEFWARDERGHCIMENAALVQHWGSILGRPPEDTPIAPGELAIWQANNGRALAGETVDEEVEYVVDGERRIFQNIVAPIRIGEEIRGILGFNIDITERKRIQAELEGHRHRLEELVAERTTELADARRRADSANRAKSAFLANMSHEIRTPMNAIIGLTHLLRQEVVEPRQRDRLAKVSEAARHLLRIVDDILDLSKIEAGRVALESRDFSLADTMAQSLRMLADRAETKGLQLIREIDPALPALLRGDPLRLGQILLNYLSNAIKFSERGPIVVRAMLAQDAGEAVLVRLEVEDRGIGIAPKDRERLFQPFTQADESTTRVYGGTGLGLIIAKRLAALMGGEVGVESEPGLGSTFWTTARLGRVTSPTAERPAADPNELAVSAQTLLARNHRGTRILLAEDDPINREVALDLLRDTGLVVDLAENGRAALERVLASDYALVLMDIQMPVMGGLEATRLIRQHPDRANLPILAMTAGAFDEDRLACLEAGMSDYIGKPVEPDRLFAVLLRWLASPASQPERSSRTP